MDLIKTKHSWLAEPTKGNPDAGNRSPFVLFPIDDVTFLKFFYRPGPSPRLQPPLILVTWSSVYTAYLQTLAMKQLITLSNCAAIVSDSMTHWRTHTVCIFYLFLFLESGLIRRREDGGTKETAQSCRVPPGWTWGGEHWPSITWCLHQVQSIVVQIVQQPK